MTTSTPSAAGTTTLVKDLRALALALEKDLLVRAGERPFAARLAQEYDRARSVERMAASWTEWLAGRVTQAAAAWVLSTVFVRFCEDNDLIARPFLSGAGERLTLAEEYQSQYFAELPTLNNRDYLVAAFAHIADAHPAAAGLFDEERNPANPLWDITPSYEAANALIAFWRRRDDAGATRREFTGWDTRFLGDLYQDLSEAARKTYALLQTPEFVEEFILDLTLTPAVEEFGLDGLRTIDPASGSGHFLLGLFRRILAAWREREPGTDDWTLIRRSMESVHGCDKNPFATAIARFRLLVAALHEGGVARLDEARDFPINVAVGDSLLHGEGAPGRQEELSEDGKPHTFSTEDIYDFDSKLRMLAGATYHVVVGNPPYITVKDKAENQAYRVYKACSGKYALSVPFAERMFHLAIRTAGDDFHAGYVGQITANSFMKREFGKKLIENFFPSVHLTHVIDTSGAYIPGHGTPTVILVGRKHLGRQSVPIRAVLGVRGEPGQPADPATGLVWSAIEEQVGKPGSESQWVTVEDAGRTTFASFPWSVSGGGAGDVFAAIDTGHDRLGGRLRRIGFYGVTGADDAMVAAASAYERVKAETEFRAPLAFGDEVRDWDVRPGNEVFHPYDRKRVLVSLEAMPAHARRLWPLRTELGNRATFTRGTYFSDGRPWYEWHQIPADAAASDWTIVFGEVATHNSFALDRSENVFARTAPILKLQAGAEAHEFLTLLSVLNSSLACFWLKQVCHNKGDSTDAHGARTTGVSYFDTYQFNSTKISQLPISQEVPTEEATLLDNLAESLAGFEPSAVTSSGTPTRVAFAAAREQYEERRKQMVSLQEELDWAMYKAYGLLSVAETAAVTAKEPEALDLGERAFEVVFARQCIGEEQPAWFRRHRSTPVVELPGHWSPEYRAVVEARIAVIESRRDIALMERPECKRRWASDPWEKKERAALETWLLDRCEAPDLWFTRRDGMRQPRTLTVSQLADRFPAGDDVHAVAALYAADHLEKRDLPLADVLAHVVADQHVPYLAAMRYQESGMVKRAEWERTWEGQREEDRTGQSLGLAVPPKYKPVDFRKPSYWSQRGKLDVPKERFVSYPEASPDADPTLLLGWAGWDHKDQAQALVNLVNDRSSQAGWETERLMPLLAGLAELMPWVRQWHGEFDEEWDGNPAEEYGAFLDQQRTERGLTEDALRQWRPAAVKRGRRPRGST